MTDTHTAAIKVLIVEEQVVFSLSALCRASGAQADQIDALVGEGLLHPIGHDAGEWQFSGSALPRTRRALRLARELEMDLSGVALVMDLLAEIDQLRSRLRWR